MPRYESEKSRAENKNPEGNGPSLSNEEMSKITEAANKARAGEAKNPQKIGELKEDLDDKFKLNADKENSGKKSFLGLEGIKFVGKKGGGIIGLTAGGLIKNLWKETKLMSKILWRTSKELLKADWFSPTEGKWESFKIMSWKEIREEFKKKENEKEKKQ